MADTSGDSENNDMISSFHNVPSNSNQDGRKAEPASRFDASKWRVVAGNPPYYFHISDRVAVWELPEGVSAAKVRPVRQSPLKDWPAKAAPAQSSLPEQATPSSPPRAALSSAPAAFPLSPTRTCSYCGCKGPGEWLAWHVVACALSSVGKMSSPTKSSPNVVSAPLASLPRTPPPVVPTRIASSYASAPSLPPSTLPNNESFHTTPFFRQLLSQERRTRRVVAGADGGEGSLSPPLTPNGLRTINSPPSATAPPAATSLTNLNVSAVALATDDDHFAPVSPVRPDDEWDQEVVAPAAFFNVHPTISLHNHAQHVGSKGRQGSVVPSSSLTTVRTAVVGGASDPSGLGLYREGTHKSILPPSSYPSTATATSSKQENNPQVVAASTKAASPMEYTSVSTYEGGSRSNFPSSTASSLKGVESPIVERFSPRGNPYPPASNTTTSSGQKYRVIGVRGINSGERGGGVPLSQQLSLRSGDGEAGTSRPTARDLVWELEEEAPSSSSATPYKNAAALSFGAGAGVSENVEQQQQQQHFRRSGERVVDHHTPAVVESGAAGVGIKKWSGGWAQSQTSIIHPYQSSQSVAPQYPSSSSSSFSSFNLEHPNHQEVLDAAASASEENISTAAAGSSGRPLTVAAATDPSEPPSHQQQQRTPCADCGRLFAPASLAVHARVCARVFCGSVRRAPYASSDKRLKGTPAAAYSGGAGGQGGIPRAPACEYCGKKYSTLGNTVKAHVQSCAVTHSLQSNHHQQQQQQKRAGVRPPPLSGTPPVATSSSSSASVRQAAEEATTAASSSSAEITASSAFLSRPTSTLVALHHSNQLQPPSTGDDDDDELGDSAGAIAAQRALSYLTNPPPRHKPSYLSPLQGEAALPPPLHAPAPPLPPFSNHPNHVATHYTLKPPTPPSVSRKAIGLGGVHAGSTPPLNTRLPPPPPASALASLKRKLGAAKTPPLHNFSPEGGGDPRTLLPSPPPPLPGSTIFVSAQPALGDRTQSPLCQGEEQRAPPPSLLRQPILSRRGGVKVAVAVEEEEEKKKEEEGEGEEKVEEKEEVAEERGIYTGGDLRSRAAAAVSKALFPATPSSPQIALRQKLALAMAASSPEDPKGVFFPMNKKIK